MTRTRLFLTAANVLAVVYTLAIMVFAACTAEKTAPARAPILAQCPTGSGGGGGTDGGTLGAGGAAGAGGGVADAGSDASSDAGPPATLFAEERFNYPNGTLLKGQDGGFGFGTGTRTMPTGSTPSCSTSTFPGRFLIGNPWLDSSVGLHFPVVTNTWPVPGYPDGTGMFQAKTLSGSNSLDTRVWRDLFKRFTTGTLWIMTATKAPGAPAPTGAFCELHIYDGVGNINADYACKEGEVFQMGKRAQSNNYEWGITAHGGAGAINVDTTIPFDATGHIQVARVDIFNTAADCDGITTCPPCNGTLCNNTITYYIDPPIGSSDPGPPTTTPKVVKGFAVEDIEIGSNLMECDFKTIRIGDAAAALWSTP